MKNKYIERLQLTICHLHKCDAAWVESVPVHEVFRGQTVWQGRVEVFVLAGHPKARKAYAGSHPENADGTGERFVTVLEIPPVDSAQMAVKTSIVSDIKAGKVKPTDS